jgi:hypothetical protein
MKSIFPFAAPDWRHRCGTKIEGVGKRREARQGGKR